MRNATTKYWSSSSAAWVKLGVSRVSGCGVFPSITTDAAMPDWCTLEPVSPFDPAAREFLPVLKPAALKNAAIDIIRQAAPAAEIGPLFPNTRKGTVAHLVPSADAVAKVHKRAQPGAIVLPRWEQGSPTRWEPVTASEAFGELAFNAFNYNVLGQTGFASVVLLVRQCPAWRLTYSRLDEALPLLARFWTEVVAGSAERRSAAEAAAAQDS